MKKIDNLKVSKQNQKIVKSTRDFNGEQTDLIHRYQVTFINDETFESNSKNEIEYIIRVVGNSSLDIKNGDRIFKLSEKDVNEMKNKIIVQTFKEALFNGELSETNNINEAIYYHKEIGLIDGEFDCGSRGLDHNTLLYKDITFSDLMANGVLLVPECNVYISNEELEIFKELERLPLDDNHFVGYK